MIDPTGEAKRRLIEQSCALEVGCISKGGGYRGVRATGREVGSGRSEIIKNTRSFRGGNFKKAKDERIKESDGVCEYCQSNKATQGDHAKTLNSFKKDVNEGKMTSDEAKKIANSKENIVASCKGCNQVDKHTKDLGAGDGQYNPPNPNDRVKDMLE